MWYFTEKDKCLFYFTDDNTNYVSDIVKLTKPFTDIKLAFDDDLSKIQTFIVKGGNFNGKRVLFLKNYMGVLPEKTLNIKSSFNIYLLN